MADDQSHEAGNETETTLPWVRPLRHLYDVNTRTIEVVLDFATTTGGRGTRLIPRSAGASPLGAMRELLNAGASTPARQSTAAADVRRAIIEQRAPLQHVTRHTGWNGTAFVLPDMVLGSNPDNVRLDPEAQFLLAHVSGTLEDWKSMLSAPLRASSPLTLMVAAAFLPPLLKRMGEGLPVMFCVTGGDRQERELALLVATGVVRRPRLPFVEPKVLQSQNASHFFAAYDQLLAVAPSSWQEDRNHRSRALAAAAKAVADSDAIRQASLVVVAADLHPDEATEAGSPPPIVPIPLASKRGLYEQEKRPKVRKEHSGLMAISVMSSYGLAFRTFVSALIEDAQATIKARKTTEQFVQKVRDELGEEYAPYARAYGLLVAAGELAADYGLIDIKRNRIAKRAMLVLKRIPVTASAGAVAASALSEIARSHTDKTLFPLVEEGNVFSESQADTALGFRRKIKGKRMLALFRDKLDKFVAPEHQLDALRQWGADGTLLPGKDKQHWVRQVKVGGLSTAKPYVLLFPCALLAQIATNGATRSDLRRK